MTSTATVSDKGQVTLPKPLRDQLGIRPGSRLEFLLGADGVLQVKVLAKGSAALAGLLARPGEAPRSPSEHEAAVTEAVRERARGRQ
jgi:AbrB family looped-hinge helix DNA binding protein